MTDALANETPVATEPTLDEVISEFNVQAIPAVPTPVPQPVTTDPLPTVDPLDENSFRNFSQSVQNGQSALNQQLQEVTSKLTNLQQERADSQVEADINRAVDTVNKSLDLDPMVVRVFLELTAQQKPGFKNIWDNRTSNPAAYQKALDAFSKELGAKFANKQDPELTKNQQAIQQSQQSMASKTVETPENSIDAELAGAKTDAEWNAIWGKYSSGAL